MERSTLLDDMLKVLEIRETKSLLSHEQTISHNLKHLKEGMLNIGHLVDPLVIDSETGVVLDGNHRLKVLEIIECPYAACQTVNYHSPEIEVGTWLPVTDKPLEEIFKDQRNIKIEKVDQKHGFDTVKNLGSPFMASTKHCSYLLNPGKYKLREMTEEQVFILSMLDSSKIGYVPDNEGQKFIDDGYTVFYRRPYTKEEIVKTAQAHAPLPPKSTRHLIPGRIIRLNMKLGWLHKNKEGAQNELENMLNNRAYNGNVRKYYEPVIVIY